MEQVLLIPTLPRLSAREARDGSVVGSINQDSIRRHFVLDPRSLFYHLPLGPSSSPR